MAADADEKIAAPPVVPDAVSPAAQALFAELGQARAHLVAGRLADAEGGYRRLLAAAPALARALHGLGVCRPRQGDAAAAAGLVGQAVTLAPDIAEFHSNLGVMLRATGRVTEAEAALRR